MRNLDESGRITWASKVTNLLFPNGFAYVWHVEDVGDQTVFMKMVKQRLIDCNKQDFPFLDGDILRSPSCVSAYSFCKSVF